MRALPSRRKMATHFIMEPSHPPTAGLAAEWQLTIVPHHEDFAHVIFAPSGSCHRRVIGAAPRHELAVTIGGYGTDTVRSAFRPVKFSHLATITSQ